MPAKSRPVKKTTRASKSSVRSAVKSAVQSATKRQARPAKLAAASSNGQIAKPSSKTAAKKKPAKQKVVKAKAKPAAAARVKPKTKRLPRPKLTPQEIEGLFARFSADTPEPKGELNYSNPYTLLVAVALSAQATDIGVNKATDKLFKLADTPQKMLALGEDKVRELVKTIGLYKTKAKNVIALSQKLLDDYEGDVPQTRDALESLPGVGRKTANVVLNIAFGQPTIAVDTHLFRVGNRTGMAPGKDPLQVELGLQKSIPEQYLLHAHHWLILHGRYICVARKPKCQVCIIHEFCKFKDKTAGH